MNANDKVLNVLLLAEACNPAWSSVPLVGYQMARALAARNDLHVTVATHVRNRPQLETSELASRATIEYIDSDAVAGPLFRLGKKLRGGDGLGFMTNTLAAYPGYIWFENLVHRRFCKDLARGRFDLIHRITPVSPTLSGPLVKLSRVPMVVGPVNGGLAWPKGYSDLQKDEREWLAPVRRLYKMMPFNRSTFRHAAAVIAGSNQAMKDVGTGNGPRIHLSENGIDPNRFPLSDSWHEPSGRFQFAFAGRLVPCKGVRFVLEAMARSAALRETDFVIVGDGPLRGELETLAAQLGIAERVQFRGWVKQNELSDILRRSQAFVFPSIREFGGGAVLEAMASGLPCIVTDYGGPAELVAEDCGIKVPIADRGNLVSHVQSAMEALLTDPARCRQLGTAAINRIRSQFTWSEKARQVNELYRQLLA
ncbi:MAG: glycosyltransferase family 4 protein [Gemmataceae bacterium]